MISSFRVREREREGGSGGKLQRHCALLLPCYKQPAKVATFVCALGLLTTKRRDCLWYRLLLLHVLLHKFLWARGDDCHYKPSPTLCFVLSVSSSSSSHSHVVGFGNSFTGSSLSSWTFFLRNISGMRDASGEIFIIWERPQNSFFALRDKNNTEYGERERCESVGGDWAMKMEMFRSNMITF